MNKNLELKDLRVGGLYDLAEYQGSNSPDLMYFVRIDGIENITLTLTNISAAQRVVVRYHPYMTFQEVSPESLQDRKIAASRALSAASAALTRAEATAAIMNTL